MSKQEDPGRLRRQQLSALMDGEAAPAEVDLACTSWRDHAGARDDWHTYHVIGEVLRSDDVISSRRRDAQFLVGLRQRLATQPTVLAPTKPIAQRGAWHRAWAAPMAVAAGFVAVAGVLVVTRMAAPDPAVPDLSASVPTQEPGRTIAAADRGARPAASGQASAAAAGQPPFDALIRDPQLDRYLAAHKQYGSTSALVVPGGVLRSATVVAPGR